MAENTDNNNWFGSWLNAAKNKSTEVFEFVKKDLEEFGSAVKNEATSVVSSTGSVIEKTLSLDSPDSTASNMKKSFSAFLGHMNTVLNPSPDDSDTEVLMVENSETVALTEYQKALYELQTDPTTFLRDPDQTLHKQFQCWLEIIDDQLSDDRIAKQVNSSEILKRQYAKMVPEIVEHQIFWKRYLFKKALLEDEFARKEAMFKREQHEKLLTEENLKWEQEDFAANIELTEEEQVELLQQYENEKKIQKLSNSPKAVNSAKISFRQESPRRVVQSTDENEIPDSKLNSALSLTPSSNSSLDEDWEKVSDIEK